MLKTICASAVAALTLAVALAAPPASGQQSPPYAEQAPVPRTRARANDAYRPGPDQPGLGVLGSDGRAEAPPPYGAMTAPPAAASNLPPPSYSGAPTYSTPPSYSSPPVYGGGTTSQTYSQGYGSSPPPYQPPYGASAPRGGYEPPPPANGTGTDSYRTPGGGGYASSQQGFGQPYSPPPSYDDQAAGRPYMSGEQPPYRSGPPSEYRQGNSFSTDEIKTAGHGFFGSISQGLASVIEHTFRKKGRPNGYILGEEAGGAFFAGLRYGQGRLYTKDAGVHNVYWQGPSLGFDAGASGSKTMILVYNLRDVGEVYDRFGGVDGSAYVVGGVGVTFLSKDHIMMAPIRSGIGLRLGANVGYLKFTPNPTWNPF